MAASTLGRMEMWGFIFGGIGGIAGLVAIVYAHIAYRGSKASGKAATDANTVARESNDIAKDAKRLAEEANEISHRAEQREIERHDVYDDVRTAAEAGADELIVDLNLQDWFTSTRQMLETAVEIRERAPAS